MDTQKGWKPIPLLLKIITILQVLWSLGSIMNLGNIYKNGIPFFGTVVFGTSALILPLLLDIIGPVIFIIGLWNREKWAMPVVTLYIAVFIINSIATFFTLNDKYPLPQIAIPMSVYGLFLLGILFKKNYFKQTL